MKGKFYIQLNKKGCQSKDPVLIVGYVNLKDKRLHIFDDNDNLKFEMLVFDINIHQDGIMFIGIEIGSSDELYFQKVWFLPKGFDNESL